MQDGTSWTPAPEDNLLDETDRDIINAHEAAGIGQAELFVLSLQETKEIDVPLLLQIHSIAFGKLYDWAGRWRTGSVIVGDLQPPEAFRIPNLMYQFLANLNFKISTAGHRDDHVECLLYAHYEFICIHPFTNGNGRIGRLLMNLVALKFGYQPMTLYHREGLSRKEYIAAMKAADTGNFEPLRRLTLAELSLF